MIRSKCPELIKFLFPLVHYSSAVIIWKPVCPFPLLLLFSFKTTGDCLNTYSALGMKNRHCVLWSLKYNFSTSHYLYATLSPLFNLVILFSFPYIWLLQNDSLNIPLFKAIVSSPLYPKSLVERHYHWNCWMPLSQQWNNSINICVQKSPETSFKIRKFCFIPSN